jgi:hypothetical protein
MNINNLTQNYISYLYLLDRKYSVDRSNKFHYLKLHSWDIYYITLFLSKLRDKDILLIFPYLTSSQNKDDAFLRLSDQFLVTNNSNPKLISEFLQSQYEKSGFFIDDDKEIWLMIKLKIVFISYF